MSKYNYPSVHDIQDLAMIYGPDCDDYRVKVWNPTEQKSMTITFCGSDKINKTINFVVTYEDKKYHEWKWKWTMFKLKLKSKFMKKNK